MSNYEEVREDSTGKMDLVEFLKKFRSLDRVLYMLEGQDIEIDEVAMDAEKFTVMEFLDSLVTYDRGGGVGYAALRDSLVRILKGERLAVVLGGLSIRDRSDIEYTISEMAFESFDGESESLYLGLQELNFHLHSNPNLVWEFVEIAVEYLKYDIE